MENRNVGICLLVIGIFFVIWGCGLLWTSFTMAEGGMLRAPGIFVPLIGFVLCILAIRKILKTSKQISA